VGRDTRLSAAAGADQGDEEELLGGGLHAGPGKYAAGAEELEGLDLDGAGSAVEVLGQHDVGDPGLYDL
jgi:hypothetical protein